MPCCSYNATDSCYYDRCDSTLACRKVSLSFSLLVESYKTFVLRSLVGKIRIPCKCLAREDDDELKCTVCGGSSMSWSVNASSVSHLRADYRSSGTFSSSDCPDRSSAGSTSFVHTLPRSRPYISSSEQGSGRARSGGRSSTAAALLPAALLVFADLSAHFSPILNVPRFTSRPRISSAPLQKHSLLTVGPYTNRFHSRDSPGNGSHTGASCCFCASESCFDRFLNHPR